MRRVIAVDAADHRLFGTLHEPDGPASGDCLLLLNAGPLPRSWNSDLPCEIGDRLAAEGIMTFRFDLPGLGDTEGEIPELVELFRQGISNGRYDRTVRELSQALREGFGLKRVVVSGLCAGAIASIRAVTTSPDEFAGMIIFEPDFRSALDASNLGHADKPPAGSSTRPKTMGGRIRLWFKQRFGRTAIEDAQWLGPVKAPLIWALSRVFGRNLPPGTNLRLVEDWRRIIGTRLPTLLLRAERGIDWRTRRILQSQPPRALAGSVSIVLVPKTNHMFNSGSGQATALKEVIDWMLRQFPSARARMDDPGASASTEPLAADGSALEAATDMATQLRTDAPLSMTETRSPSPAPRVRTAEQVALHKQVVRGSAWTIAGYGASQVVRLASNLIMTRLLFPDSFGVMSLVNIVMQGLQMFSDIGIRPSIIQSKRGDDPVFLNTAWTMSCVRGVFLWFAACAAAWPISRFYEKPELAILIPISGITALIAGFNSTSLATANRKLALGKLTVLEFMAQLMSVIVVIAWASISPSVWALVGGGVANSIIYLVLSHTWLPGIRHRFTWDKDCARSLIKFGRWIFMSTAISFLAVQCDPLVLGKLASSAALGVYNTGKMWAQLPSTVFQQLVGRVFFPVISRMFHGDTFDPKQINDLRVRLLLPVALGSAALFVVAEPMIHILYREPYWGAAPNLAIIALGCWVGTICHTYGNVLLGAGRPKYITFATAIKTVAFLSLAYPCFQRWDVPGIAIAVSISEFGSLVPMLIGARTIGVAIPGKEFLLTLVGAAYGGLLYGLQWTTVKVTGSVTAGFVVCAVLTAGLCMQCLRSLMSHLRRVS